MNNRANPSDKDAVAGSDTAQTGSAQGPSVRDAGRNARIHRLVKEIPPGQVATYGQLAAIIGNCTARQAGYAMSDAGDTVPWHRVLNAQGKVSERSGGEGAVTQRMLLEDEGVVFTKAGRLNFDVCGWAGPDPAVMEYHGFHDAPPAGMRR